MLSPAVAAAAAPPPPRSAATQTDVYTHVVDLDPQPQVGPKKYTHVTRHADCAHRAVRGCHQHQCASRPGNVFR